jgi:3-dehydroquinate synthase
MRGREKKEAVDLAVNSSGNSSGHCVEQLRVELAERGYDIRIGSGLIERAGEYLAPLVGAAGVVVVTDKTVAGLYLPALERALDAGGIVCRHIVLPPGERTKDFAHLEDLVERLLEMGVERQSVLIALGGGVIGDLAGFAAAILLRGINFVQIPTTLLAQVDSSVGGKTGINGRHGKNLIGSFYQPLAVLADTGTLATLPRREWLAGYAEVVKYGLIRDAEFFAWLEASGQRVLDGDAAALRRAVKTSCAAKAAIVAADEREAGERALLNFGHSFAHAFEAECGYGEDLRHGEAVAIGMVLAFDLSVRLGLCPASHAKRVRRHFLSVGLPTGPNDIAGRRFRTEDLLTHMARDKKVRDGRLTFVLSRGIGKAFLTREVEAGAVRDLFEAAGATLPPPPRRHE